MTSPPPKRPLLLAAHWRPFAALAFGVVAGLAAARVPLLGQHPLLVGWDAGALLYLGLTPIGSLLAVWMTATATRRLVSWRIR